MLHSADSCLHPSVRIGDSARLPLDLTRIGDATIDHPVWDVVAFGGAGRRHCVLLRRRRDGATRWLANHWLDAAAPAFYGRGARAFPDLAYLLDRWERRGTHDAIWQRLTLLAARLGLPQPQPGPDGCLPVPGLGHLAAQLGLDHTATVPLLWYARRTPVAQIAQALLDTLTCVAIAAAYGAAERRR